MATKSVQLSASDDFTAIRFMESPTTNSVLGKFAKNFGGQFDSRV